MAGASALKLVKYFVQYGGFTSREIFLLVVGTVTAFAVSLTAIRLLLDYIRKHTFTAFGVYRILLGIAVLACFGVQW